MGNGSGLKSKTTILIDIESKPFSWEDLEKAAQAAIANFGKPNQIFMPMGGFASIYEPHPEYHGTPWANSSRLTKRERRVAGLHTTLKKLGALKNLSEEDMEEIRIKSIKRLRRARWARYQQDAK